MKESNRKTSSAWMYAAVPTLIVLFLALYPQINIWMVKGSDWNGAYVVSNYDEVAYSGYVNSLIEGRPRTNDPFLGRDDGTAESLYSIQVVPAYTIAFIAKVFGLSASGVFVLLNFLIPLFASLSIFVLLRSITSDRLLAAIGVLVVLCFGAAIAFEGELQHMILQNYLCDFFPFLRRYQPGFAFPIFFVFCFLAWRMLSSSESKKGIGFAAATGAVFAILVFSYFFLWTAALAWLACFALTWFVVRKDERRSVVTRTAIVGVCGIAAIIPYSQLLANRPQNMDDAQLLSFTRAPNLFEISEIVGAIVIATIVYLVRRGKLTGSPTAVFTLSLALTPFVLFNQQVVTGRSLQPVHYEIFIANYLGLLALVLLAWQICVSLFGSDASSKMKRGLIYVGLAAVIWGFVESTATTRRNAAYERVRDDAMPALQYLRELERSDPPINGRYRTVMATTLLVADFLPTMTSYRPLWNPHTNSAGGVNEAENRELFYHYLYYSGFDEKDVAKALEAGIFEVKAAFFGGGRAVAELDKNAKPITRAEAETEIRNYGKYSREFDRSRAADPELSYMIVPTLAEPNFEKVDLWYQRDDGQEFGFFKVYRLTLKP